MNTKPLLWVAVPLMCLAALAVQAQLQGQRPPPVRQIWEYKSMSFIIEGTVSGAKTVLYEDGQRLPGSPTPIERAPDLGNQGWELVSIAATESQRISTFVYWFKRPK